MVVASEKGFGKAARFAVSETEPAGSPAFASICFFIVVHAGLVVIITTAMQVEVFPETSVTVNCTLLFPKFAQLNESGVAVNVTGWQASHGRSGVSKLIMGSITQKVLARSRIPVVVYR